MKQEGDIIVYGGASFVSGLFQQGLLDEFHLFINPVAIGKGLSVFNNLLQNRKLKLLHARASLTVWRYWFIKRFNVFIKCS